MRYFALQIADFLAFEDKSRLTIIDLCKEICSSIRPDHFFHLCNSYVRSAADGSDELHADVHNELKKMAPLVNTKGDDSLLIHAQTSISFPIEQLLRSSWPQIVETISTKQRASLLETIPKSLLA